MRGRTSRIKIALAAVGSVALAGCGDDGGPPPARDAGLSDGAPVDSGPPPVPAAHFDLSGEAGRSLDFFAFPFPSDLRLTTDERPDLTGYPRPARSDVIDDILRIADDRTRWPVLPVATFRFGAPVAPLALETVYAADATHPLLLVDVDPASPARGALAPVHGITHPTDIYTGANLVSVAPLPGYVLHPNRTYALVIRRALGDATGAPLEVPAALAALARGETPDGEWGAAALALYTPMFETLDMLGVPRDEVAAATVFTTGDVVADTRALTESLRAREDVTIDALRLDAAYGTRFDRYCTLAANVSMPQYQRGTPPFPDEGTFELGADGAPIEQRREDVKVIFTIPRVEMPAAGYPLMTYFHGSGGVAAQVVERGPHDDGEEERVGEGPAHVIAEHGIASMGAALPLSPDRLPGAGATAYLNFDNLAAFRDTFRQGVIEQRLLLDAALALEIPAALLASCDGATLPAGATAYRFDPAALVAMGQSMGGMYTNMIGALEERYRALAPTGAGGYWAYFILETMLVPGARNLLGILLHTSGPALSYMHPALHLVTLGWEAAEPFVYMPRLSRRPLDGMQSRPVYQPAGLGDSYFPPQVFDAAALAYGNVQAGEVVWPEMQEWLAYAGLDGVAAYPVRENLTSERGEAYTGAVVQSAGDGFSDPHHVFMQVPEIRYQWGCFLATGIRGAAVIPAPAAFGTRCADGL